MVSLLTIAGPARSSRPAANRPQRIKRSFFPAIAMLNLTVRELAEKAGVHRNTITRAETDETAHGHAVAQVVLTLEAAGVEFVPENGGGRACD